MFIAAPASPQAAMESVRRLLAETAAGLSAPSAITAAATIGADGEPALLADLRQRMAGRSVPALVLSRIDQTQGTVEIAGEQVRVAARLPEAGRTVMLRFAPAADDVAASNPPQIASPPAPGAGAPALKVVMSVLGQSLSQLASREAAPLALGAVAAAVQTPQAFAPALAALVRDSGVFYESHLARWSRGQYPLTRLQSEPQARGAGSAAAPTFAPAAAPDGALGPAGEPGLHALTLPASQRDPETAVSEPLVAAQLQPILREQLDVLERRSLAVSLEAWPGQAVLLAIRDQRDDPAGSERDAHGQTHAGDALPWSSRLTLDLPRLGRLHVELGLSGNRMQLVLQADRNSAVRLGRGAAALSDAMTGAGIRLAGLRIVDAADV